VRLHLPNRHLFVLPASGTRHHIRSKDKHVAGVVDDALPRQPRNSSSAVQAPDFSHPPNGAAFRRFYDGHERQECPPIWDSTSFSDKRTNGILHGLKGDNWDQPIVGCQKTSINLRTLTQIIREGGHCDLDLRLMTTARERTKSLRRVAIGTS
jgi:hypothetical protein